MTDLEYLNVEYLFFYIHRNITFAKLTYLLTVSLLIVTAVRARKYELMDKLQIISSGLVICWSMLTMLLFRSHNIVLFAMINLIELIVSKVCQRSVVLVTIIYFWFASTSFFLQVDVLLSCFTVDYISLTHRLREDHLTS